MQTTAIVVMVYGVLVAAGGVIGFLKARSAPSLVAGVGFGVALLASGVLLWQGMRQAMPGAVALAAVLLVVMGSRLRGSRKFMPAGLVALLSLAVVIWLAANWRA